ncbi:MAG TPA: caspase family protein [Tenuifilaceae bacterium]|nr:caspase family protein [Tenuifilaceae bacterium]
MKKFWKLLPMALLALTLGKAKTNAQEFTDLTTKQLGNNITIEYAIVGEQLGQVFSVTPSYSTDGGKTFLPIKSASGYIGNSILGGKNQVIIWDVLKDLPELKGDVSFKLTGNTQKTIPLEDDFSNLAFKLISLHKTGNNQLELILDIKNEGAQRDLKLINGLITLTDFNKRNFDAQRGKLGDVVGSQRYSTPQKTIKKGETLRATFTFDNIPKDLERIMKLSIGAELLTFSEFGLDNLEISTLQFRDFPVSAKPTTSKSVTSSKRFEATTSGNFSVQKQVVQAKKPETDAPMLSILKPEGVSLIGSEATRGRPYAQSSSGLDDRRLRSVTPNDGITVQSETLFVQGTATDKSGIYEVTVNGNNATLKGNGVFEATVNLKMGRNDIVIRSMDIYENSVERKFLVFRKDSPGQKVVSDTEELDLVFDAPRAPKYYALIVGVNEYPDPGISTLSNPVKDAAMLAKVLTEKYTFEVQDITFLKNPTRGQFIDELDKITRRIGKNDNLLIFYAGHGYFDSETEFGYWLPSDASASSTGNWLANSQLKDYVAAIKSKHTLLIADACFGGSIFKTRKAFADATDNVDKVYDRKSRKAMTSGALTEVPDESAFIKHLVQRLEENTIDYLPAEELFSSFKTAVMNSSPTVPQYGDIKGTGDEGGDFVFVRR